MLILDNRTTAMTGHQGNPGTGVRPDKTPGTGRDLQALCDGIGVRCTTVDAKDYKAARPPSSARSRRPAWACLWRRRRARC